MRVDILSALRGLSIWFFSSIIRFVYVLLITCMYLFARSSSSINSKIDFDTVYNWSVPCVASMS